MTRPSPAPAGIHPDVGQLHRPAAPLPRTRGDPPGLVKVYLDHAGPPPHPRGSTRLGNAADRRGGALPRTRGDPPRTRGGPDATADPPPHPRGSTHHFRVAPLFADPSPAPAGIHPLCAAPLRAAGALPRTRGDPPRTRRRTGCGSNPPPHPRGSTPCVRSRIGARSPSPAPAGIHLGEAIVARYLHALPRTRGDPPHVGKMVTPSTSPPPHPRGSTR